MKKQDAPVRFVSLKLLLTVRISVLLVVGWWWLVDLKTTLGMRTNPAIRKKDTKFRTTKKRRNTK